MALGLVGKKAGMTRVFTEDGASVPVTVIEITPNRVSQIKTCLLYTSPSPRDAHESRMPSSA